MDLSSLLSAEIWPWVRDTATIGAVAGIVSVAARVLYEKRKQLPMIDHKMTYTRHPSGAVTGSLAVTVYNRAAAPLEFQSLKILSPEGVKFQPGQRTSADGKTAYVGLDIPSSLPGADKWSSGTKSVGIVWSGEAKARIFVAMRSNNQLVVRRLSRISITLMNNMPIASDTANPTASAAAPNR
jgi:hypothetical protein